MEERGKRDTAATAATCARYLRQHLDPSPQRIVAKKLQQSRPSTNKTTSKPYPCACLCISEAHTDPHATSAKPVSSGRRAVINDKTAHGIHPRHCTSSCSPSSSTRSSLHVHPISGPVCSSPLFFVERSSATTQRRRCT